MRSLPYRPNVCLLILNRDGKLFLGQRHGQVGVWQFPQGGVEEGSSLEENALREAEEELGVCRTSFDILLRLQATHRYDFSNPPDYAIGKWRGQEQTFFLLKFLGEDADISLARYSPEFDAFRWCSAQEVRHIAEAKRLPGYEAPLREVEAFLRGTC